ncbi:cutinase family protein [Streptomyces sp. NPDC005407]|uniref:cutinase family protein n=1 Tax=Streptomyces sp. NPDC005407 TaxID=3155340 RepID=UPI0033B8264B
MPEQPSVPSQPPSVPGDSTSPKSKACEDVAIVYVRGFNEPDKDLGKWAFDPLVKKLRPPFNVKTVTVDWPALPGRGSLDVGNKNLVDYLEMEHQRSPDVCFVLVGYSLGADVIQDSLGAGPHVVSAGVGLQIRGIELFGNPYRKFNSERSTPPEYRGRTVDTCNANDLLCDPAAWSVEVGEACRISDLGSCVTPAHLTQTYVRTGLVGQATTETTCIVVTGKRCERPSHTVVAGDTLSALAEKAYGDASKWQTIYDANRSLIENAAQDHRGPPVFGSSDNGHWIFPGTALVIPPTP